MHRSSSSSVFSVAAKRAATMFVAILGTLAAVFAITPAGSARTRSSVQVLGSTAGQTVLTWTGGDRKHDLWSSTANWSGRSTPRAHHSYQTLILDQLARRCWVLPLSRKRPVCYTSDNDLAGVSVQTIDIDNGAIYRLTGKSLRLGSGGLQAKPGNEFRPDYMWPWIATPLVLTAPQSWTLDGGPFRFGWVFVGSVSGRRYPLTINQPNLGNLLVNGSFDVGPLTVDGEGSDSLIQLNNPGEEATVFHNAHSDLNGKDREPITLEGSAGLFLGNGDSTIGPLDDEGGPYGSLVQAGDGLKDDGTLTIAGNLTLGSAEFSTMLAVDIEHPGTVPGTDYSRFRVRGNVNLETVQLYVQYGLDRNVRCVKLHVGDVYPILSATGTISGTFTGQPDGSTVQFQNSCNSSPAPMTGTLHYTAHTVTVTITAGG